MGREKLGGVGSEVVYEHHHSSGPYRGYVEVRVVGLLVMMVCVRSHKAEAWDVRRKQRSHDHSFVEKITTCVERATKIEEHSGMLGLAEFFESLI